MNKLDFRPRSRGAPDYPDLERFDEDRRRFLRGLGAAVLGSALLLPGSLEAGEDRQKGEDKKKKKKAEKGKDRPRPPNPGGPMTPRSRLDRREDDRWASEAARPRRGAQEVGADKDAPANKKEKREKKPKHPSHTRPTLGKPLPPGARLDEEEGLE